MKLSKLIDELEHQYRIHGDIEVELQDTPRKDGDQVMDYPDFFIVDEKYEDGWWVNLRSWCY
jgi:hypothetical protein